MNPLASVSTEIESQDDRPWMAASSEEAAWVARQAAWLLAGVLALAAVVLCWRRLAGALDLPLGLPFLAAAGGLAVLLAVGARTAARWAADVRNPTTGQCVLSWLVSCSLVAWAASLTMPGVSRAGILMVYALVAVEECWRLGVWFQRTRLGNSLRDELDAWARRLGWRWRPLTALDLDTGGRSPQEPDTVADQPVPSGEVVQELLRLRSEDGAQWLRGRLRTLMAPGQRTVSVHAAFCPPFSSTPNVSVDQSEGPPARVKVAQLLPYGVRFDIRLGDPAEETVSLGLRFTAQVPGSQEREMERSEIS